VGAASAEAARRGFAPPEPDGEAALFVVAQGIAPAHAAQFDERVRAALRADSGTPAARLLRAVTAACRELEAGAQHRFALAGFGFTAVLVEARYAQIVQLPPCQAYVLDGDGLHLCPEEQMSRADQLASTLGRSWEVELEVSRATLRAATTILLCSTSVAAGLAPPRVAGLLRLPAQQAARRIVPGGARRGSVDGCDAIVIAVAAPKSAAGPRLFPIADRLSLRRLEPLDDARPAAPPIEAWGLERERRTALGGLFDRLIPARDVVHTSRPRPRHAPWPAAAALLILLAAGGAWASTRAAAPWRPRPQATPIPTPLPPTPAPNGRTVYAAALPLVSFGVGETTDHLMYVAGDAGAPSMVHADGTPDGSLALPPAAPPGLVAARDADALWLDAKHALWLIGPGKPARQVAVRATAWQRPAQIAVYANNLYVLDPGANQIWRHDANAAGDFPAEPLAWLQPGNAGALDGASGMAIDGAIWIIRTDGTIVRLNAGKREPFETAGLPSPIGAGGAIYTEAEYKALYVVDAANRRLVQIGKDGQFQREVPNVYPDGETPRGLWVDEPGGRALILTTGRVQEVSLGQS
jgi:hypothetical protein